MGDLNDELKRLSREGEVERAVALVRRGAPVSSMDLGYAISCRMVPLVAAMVGATTFSLTSMFTFYSPTLEIAQILLESGRVEVDEALAECITGEREVAELLIRCGAKPDAGCLQRAIERDSVATYEWLVSLGVPETPKSGQSLMHLARSVAMVRLLAERGHPIDEIDAQGASPLHAMAERMASDAIDELVRRGADPSRRDHAGRTYVEVLQLAWEEEQRRPY